MCDAWLHSEKNLKHLSIYCAYNMSIVPIAYMAERTERGSEFE